MLRGVGRAVPGAGGQPRHLAQRRDLGVARGRGTATRSTGQGSLPICVRDVLTRVSYPATGNLVRLVVAVRYRGGAVVVEPKVQNVTPKGQLIDLRP
jgi:hypothetical protein